LTNLGRALLNDLGDKLETTQPVLTASEAELLGGLIYAARRSPIEAVKANVAAYKDLQLEVSAVEAVCAFLRAHDP
jgi:hypothetical protein